MRFIPSEHSYGVDEASAANQAAYQAGQPPVTTPTSSPPSPEQYTTYATAARALLGLDTDAREKLRVKQAALDNYKRLAASSSGLVRAAYMMKIRTLEAEISALQSQATEAGISAASMVTTKVAVSGMAIAGVVVVSLIGYNLWLSSKYLQKKAAE